MVHQKISNDMKERALFLPLGAEWEIERIPEALGVPARSIGQLQENYALHGCVKPLKSIKGRPRLLTGDMIDDIKLLLCGDPTFLLDEIKEWLALYHDQPISTTALHMNLRDLLLTHKRLKRVAIEREDATQTLTHL